jgi:hypothetical protein
VATTPMSSSPAAGTSTSDGEDVSWTWAHRKDYWNCYCECTQPWTTTSYVAYET